VIDAVRAGSSPSRTWFASPVRSKRRIAVAIAALTLVLPVVAVAAKAETGAQPRKITRNLLGGGSEEFVALARRVANSGSDVQAEFARIALEEMGSAFQQEATAAREMPIDPQKTTKRERDPRKWAAATSSYAGRLFGLSEAIQMGANASVEVEPEGTIVLLVGGSQVIVSGPRLDKPRQIEDRITNRVCLDPGCAALASASYDGFGGPGGRWSFPDTDAPVFVTGNGLNFLFDDRDNLPNKERACLALSAELDSIVQTLKNLLWQNHAVDWSAIAVRADTTDATMQVLRVNNTGDFIRLALPELARVPYVLQSAMPWVRSQVEGRNAQHYVQLPPGIF
jgi:hypothetical protein